MRLCWLNFAPASSDLGDLAVNESLDAEANIDGINSRPMRGMRAIRYRSDA